MPERIIQVRGPHYTAGIILQQNEFGSWEVVDAAPILKWTIRRRWDDELKPHFRKRGIGYQEVANALKPDQKNDANNGN